MSIPASPASPAMRCTVEGLAEELQSLRRQGVQGPLRADVTVGGVPYTLTLDTVDEETCEEAE